MTQASRVFSPRRNGSKAGSRLLKSGAITQKMNASHFQSGLLLKPRVSKTPFSGTISLAGRRTNVVQPYMLFAFPQFPPQQEWTSNSSERRGKELRNANLEKGSGGKPIFKLAICCKRLRLPSPYLLPGNLTMGKNRGNLAKVVGLACQATPRAHTEFGQVAPMEGWGSEDLWTAKGK